MLWAHAAWFARPVLLLRQLPCSKSSRAEELPALRLGEGMHGGLRMTYWPNAPDAEAFIQAARVPVDLHPQRAGAWKIERHALSNLEINLCPWIGFRSVTLLKHPRFRPLDPEDPYDGMADCGRRREEIVMEDSRRELARHLPAWRHAHGRVLVSGLGLGCVVRGLLASPRVEHIDVVELDADILSLIAPEFASNERVALHHGDATQLALEGPWDFAWHDICDSSETHIQVLHAKLFVQFQARARRQGAWMFPRRLKHRLLPRERFAL